MYFGISTSTYHHIYLDMHLDIMIILSLYRDAMTFLLQSSHKVTLPVDWRDKFSILGAISYSYNYYENVNDKLFSLWTIYMDILLRWFQCHNVYSNNITLVVNTRYYKKDPIKLTKRVGSSKHCFQMFLSKILTNFSLTQTSVNKNNQFIRVFVTSCIIFVYCRTVSFQRVVLIQCLIAFVVRAHL